MRRPIHTDFDRNKKKQLLLSFLLIFLIVGAINSYEYDLHKLSDSKWMITDPFVKWHQIQFSERMDPYFFLSRFVYAGWFGTFLGLAASGMRWSGNMLPAPLHTLHCPHPYHWLCWLCPDVRFDVEIFHHENFQPKIIIIIMDAGITFKSWTHITLNSMMHKTDDYELRMKNMKYFPWWSFL